MAAFETPWSQRQSSLIQLPASAEADLNDRIAIKSRNQYWEEKKLPANDQISVERDLVKKLKAKKRRSKQHPAPIYRICNSLQVNFNFNFIY